MDEQNKVPEEQNIEKSKEEVKEQDNSVPENVGASEPVAEIPVPIAPKPKLPLIIGGIIAGVAAVAVAVALVLGGGDLDVNSHEHSFSEWTVVSDASCVATGKEERVCDCGEKDSRVINVLDHQEVVDDSVDPTCSSTGLTEGKHCSVCNTVIVAQTTVGKIPHTYDDKYDEKCNVCGFERDAECAHSETEIVKGKDATCTATGLTEGKHCSVCDYVIVEQKTLPLANHTYDNDEDEKCNVCDFVRDVNCKHTETITLQAATPTCTASGLTEGKKCAKCEEVIVAQTTVGALGHVEVIDSAVAATCTTDGKTEGKHCSRCNETLVAQTAVGSLGHVEVIDNAVAATCTTDGKTEGKHCSRCNETLVAQTTIGALGHDFTNYVSDNNATYESDGTKTAKCNNVGCNAKDTIKDIGSMLIKSEISFATLTVNGTTAQGVVSNATEVFSFGNEISTTGNADYIVALDEFGIQTSLTKNVPLTVGDNTFYVFQTVDGKTQNTYVVTIRRRPIYQVTFDTKGGTTVATQNVEEGGYATIPSTVRDGYTLINWNYDFATPVMNNIEIVADWQANTNTAYKIEYYLENISKTGYDLIDTINLSGTTGAIVTAEERNFDHFTYNENDSSISGEITGNGNLVLKVYYTRNTYAVSVDTAKGCGAGTGEYPYGSTVTFSLTDTNIGYCFTGWYAENALLGNEGTYTITIDKNIEAKFDIVDELKNYTFTSTTTTCTITGVIDNTLTELTFPGCVTSIASEALSNCTNLKHLVIPDNITSIEMGAFSGCSSLESITLPFVGHSITIGTNFGYVFGDEYYNGSIATEQSLSMYQYETYYLPESLKTITVMAGKIPNYAFDNCKLITSIIIENGVTDIGYNAFEGCKSLTSIEIPDSVTRISSEAFVGCSSLESMIVPFLGYSSDSPSVLSYFFGGSSYSHNATRVPSSLHTIIISSGEELKACAFYECSNIKNITLPKTLTKIGQNAFNSCTSLETITIPENVNYIAMYAFSGCSNLTDIYVEGPYGWSVYSSSSATTGTEIDDFYVSSTYFATRYLKTDYNNYIWKRDPGACQHKYTEWQTIEEATCFYDGKEARFCTRCNDYQERTVAHLEHDLSEAATCTTDQICYLCNTVIVEKHHTSSEWIVDTPATFEHSGEKSKICSVCGERFDITEIPIQSFEYTEINNGTEYSIVGIGTVTDAEITIPREYSGKAITQIDSLGNATWIKKLVISNNVRQITSGALKGLTTLEELEIPFVGNRNSASGLDGVFGIIFGYSTKYSSSATTQYYDKSSYPVSDPSYYYFNIPRTLEKVTVTNAYTIPAFAFNRCRGFDLYLSSSVTSIQKYAFEASSLKSINLTEGLTHIYEDAFYASQIEEITFPKSLRYIGSNAFVNCYQLKKVTFLDTQNWKVYYYNGMSYDYKYSVDVSDPSTNATLFTDSWRGYCSYLWQK